MCLVMLFCISMLCSSKRDSLLADNRENYLESFSEDVLTARFFVSTIERIYLFPLYFSRNLPKSSLMIYNQTIDIHRIAHIYQLL